MNEVTTIHLGRQAFTIAADARRHLEQYLHAIAKQVDDDKDLLEEIESRMAELLTECHITKDKVVLEKDIAYLKEQLGDPRDFGDGDQVADASEAEPTRRRFFRDTKNGTIAGVAAGLGAFTGIPVILWRLLFIVLTVSGGFGVLIYVALWVLTPEAKTPSERLQMQGVPVTVDSLKDMVDRADVPQAAHRVGAVLGQGISNGLRIVGVLLRVVLIIIGIGFMIAGLGAVAGSIFSVTYALAHGVLLGGHSIFPIGRTEVETVICGAVSLLMIALILLAVGYSMVKRHWALPGWMTAGLITLFVVASSLGTALAFEVKSAVAQRVRQAEQSQFIAEPMFTSVTLGNTGDVAFDFQTDTKYGVELRSIGKVDPADFHIKVTNKVLFIDAALVDPDTTQRCLLVCPFGNDNIEVVVHAPSTFDGMVFKGDDTSMDVPPFVQPMPLAPGQR